MEYESVGEGIEEDLEMNIPDILYSFFYNLHESKEAERVLNEILTKWPMHDLALRGKAWMLLNKNEISKAEEHIDKALKIFPEDPFHLEAKGFIEYEKGNKEEAKEYYKRAASSRYADKEVGRRSLEMMLRISKELGDEKDAAYCQANLLILEEKYDDALSILEKLTLQSEEDAKFNKMGVIYYYKKDYQKALKYIEKAIEINPAEPGYYYNKGFYLEQLSKYRDAKENYEKALKINPNLIEAKMGLQTLDTK